MDESIINDLKDFIATSYAAAEIVIPKGKKAKCLCESYRKAIKKLGFNLTITVRKDRMYMLKGGKTK
jgi:hypothetical protein